VLNVDHHRERCEINGLNQAKLRRVAFCVDVEIAPMPKYGDENVGSKKFSLRGNDKDQKKKLKEKGEGEALKNPKAVEVQKEEEGTIKATGEQVPKEPEQEGAAAPGTPTTEKENWLGSKTTVSVEKPSSDSRKKEKKKKSEEERKARKEKRRKLAEANGTIPMEIHVDSDSDTSSMTPSSVQEAAAPRTQAMPTTNPVRIYRRCCQLRETPILKKITEQLTNPVNMAEPGVVQKLDLTGYWMQLPDLITLGDYLAVVPVKEVILENCGLADEGLRVILAGLLAARKPPTYRKRRPVTEPDGLTPQGGVVERLVLKNNKLGPEGWKHICLFLYLCRTVKSVDLSGIPFPQPVTTPGHTNGNANGATGPARTPLDICRLLSRSLGERLGGSTLSLLNLGETGLNTEQLAIVMDGVIKCGIKRLGLAHNDISKQGLEHVAKFLKSNLCEGLDLGGNDLRDQLTILADALERENVEDSSLWELSLADCNLTPSSLCKLLTKLVKLPNFRFIDLSHNHELFNSEPSAIAVLRKYLPKMICLKRIHLADCSLSPEQVIALAEIIPEITGLAHISLVENPQLVELTTDTNTEEIKEEACALFASLLSAARVSTNLVAVDIEVPSDESSDLVKAMAKQVVAYCLRNMERLSVPDLGTSVATLPPLSGGDNIEEPKYPDVLQRLVGHDVMQPSELDVDVDAAPDDDYVIGGTGVVKALACCLKNRGDDSRRDFLRELEGEEVRSRSSSVVRGSGRDGEGVEKAKAKATSKHLLLSARKIRHRLQPAIIKARAASSQDTHAYHRLIFLDNTLKGIIKRFEDEFPDTRESADSAIGLTTSSDEEETIDEDDEKKMSVSLASSIDVSALVRGAKPSSSISDNEEDLADATEIRASGLVRSNSSLSLSSKALADEEARVLRAGHKFRSGIVRPEHYVLLSSGVEMVGADPNHARLLHELLEELQDETLKEEVAQKGVVRVYQEKKDYIMKKLQEADPVHWDRFVESMEMARANVTGIKEGPVYPVKGASSVDEDNREKAREAEEVLVMD